MRRVGALRLTLQQGRKLLELASAFAQVATWGRDPGGARFEARNRMTVDAEGVYYVAVDHGTTLGRATTGSATGGRYAAVTLGLAILLVLGLVPVLGAIVMSIAVIVGAGAIALVTWRSLRGSGAQTATS